MLGSKRRRYSRSLLACLLSSGALIAAELPSDANAQGTTAAVSQSFRFDIPAKPLANAISDIGAVTGWRIAYTVALPRGASSRSLRGSMTPEVAISHVLSGTGLAYRVTGTRSIVVFDPAAGSFGQADDGSLLLDTIDVIAAGARDPADVPYATPGSSSYISREEIERQRETTVGDTFKGVPGVLTGDDNNGPKFDVSIRGLGIDRVPVRVDGASAAVTEYRGYSGAAASNYVDPDLIGSITIKKGPDAGAEGAGAIGGLVSMRTIGADDILKPGSTYGVRLRGGLGDNTRSPVGGQIAGTYAGGSSKLWDGESYNGSAAFATRHEHFDFVAAYVHRESGNYFAGADGPETITIPERLDRNRFTPFVRPPITMELSNYYKPGMEVLNTSQDIDSWLAKGTLRFGDGHTLELAHLGYRNGFGQSMPSMTQIVLPDYNKQLELAATAQDNYTARYRWDPAGNDLIDLRINASHVRLDNQTMMNNLWHGDIEPFMSSRTKSSRGDISNTSRLRSAWGDLSLTYGASYSFEDMVPLQSRAESSFLSSNGTREMTSLFAHGEWEVSSWLKLNAGLRYDRYRTKDRADVADLQQPGNGGLSPDLAGLSLEGDGLSPSISITVTPFAGLQLYAMYAEGFRAPNIWEATNNVIALNPLLKPERAQNWEFGVNFSRDDLFTAGDKMRLKVSYFDNTIHDLIVRDYYFTTPNFFRFYYRRNNYDRARFAGVELSAQYDMGPIFAGLSATYYTKIEYCRDPYPEVPGEYYWPSYGTGCQDNPYANDYSVNQVPPQFSASALLGVRLFDDRLTISGRVTHMGNRAGSYLDNVLPSQLWVAYTIYDAFLSYKINENVSLDVSAENLTDRYYFKPLSQASLPAPGRTIRANITSRF